jgi:hypothetical protein
LDNIKYLSLQKLHLNLPKNHNINFKNINLPTLTQPSLLSYNISDADLNH